MVFASLAFAGGARAEDRGTAAPDVGVGRGALPELYDVGVLPTPSPGRAALAASLGYGYTEGVLGEDEAHHRAGLGLAGSYALVRWLSVAARFDGRYDAQAGGADDGDDGVLGASRVAVRGGTELVPRLWLGGELDLRFPPAADITLGFATLGFDVRGLATYALAPRTVLTGNLGFRLDRSDAAVDGVERLSGADRVALGASSSNALLIGVGAAHGLDRVTLLGEVGWDVLVGSASPVVTRSPLRLVLGGRYALSRMLQLELLAGLTASGRARAGADDPLVPIEPRLWLTGGIAYRFFAGALPGTLPPTGTRLHGKVVDEAGQVIAGASVESGGRTARTGADGAFSLRALAGSRAELRVEANGYASRRLGVRLRPPALDLGAIALVQSTGSLRGRVLDANGAFVPRARVSVNSAGRDVVCDDQGAFALADLPAGTLELYVQAPQWEPLTVPAVVLPGRELQLDVVLREQLPVGQIRGTVRSPKGEPVLAEVGIEELAVREATAADGTFTLDVQPGHYTVTVSAVGYEREQRGIDVEHNGVTVLLIDLRGAR